MLKAGVLMDPIEQIAPHKDTSLALMLEMQRRGIELYYLTPHDLWLQDGIIWGRTYPIKVFDDSQHWFELADVSEHPLSDLDILFMRKDPPFDMDYVYITYLLELAAQQGLWVINNPKSLRDANEKLFTAWFPTMLSAVIGHLQHAAITSFH